MHKACLVVEGCNVLIILHMAIIDFHCVSFSLDSKRQTKMCPYLLPTKFSDAAMIFERLCKLELYLSFVVCVSQKEVSPIQLWRC